VSDELADIPFSVHLERRPAGDCVVVAIGEVDLHAAPELDRYIRQCEDGELSQIVVDLTDATLLDSTALGVLVAAHNRLAKQQVPLKLACTNRLILRVLTTTGLDRVFSVHDSTLAALDGQGAGKDGVAFERAPKAPGAASES
jgi:anti-sigma B factor antagonist